MQDTYSYDVAILNFRKDVRIAKALYRALHRYRVPSAFVDEVKHDVTVRHIDRFNVCPSSNHRDDNIERAERLVVVCSPDSASKGAHDVEELDACVEKFVALGRKDKIIPVVIDDDAPDISTRPAYVPCAIAREKISPVRMRSCNRKDFRAMLLGVVCRILNLRPDQFEKLTVSDSRLRRRYKRIILGAAAVLLAGLFLIDSERTVAKYYAGYVDSFGLPEGIFPLDAAELERRNIHYRFEYEGFQFGASPHSDSADWCAWNLVGLHRKLVRVIQANSHGYPAISLHPEQMVYPEIQQFEYDGNRLCKIDMFHHSRDEFNPELEGSVLLSNLIPDQVQGVFGLKQEVVNGCLSYVAPDGRPADFDGLHIREIASGISRLVGVSRHFVYRDACGRAERRLFFNCFLNNVPDGNGAYGYQSEYDRFGRPTTWRFLVRKTGTIVCGADYHGICGIGFQYGQRNLSRKEYYVGSNISATNNANTAIACVYDYDSFGNNIRCCVVNGNGAFAPFGKGNTGIDAEYDSFGNLIRLSFVRTSDESRGGVARPTEIRREYDEFGNVVKESFFDADGRSVLCEDGFATAVYLFEGYGNPVKVSYLDSDGTLTLHKDGNAGLKYHTSPDKFGSTEAFDRDERGISPYLVAIVSDVWPGLSAEKSGIKQGDVVCKFNRYDILEAENACEAFVPVRASKGSEKEICLARKVGTDYEIRGYHFPAGMVGFETGVKYIYDHEKLVRAYRIFNSNGKGKRGFANDW